MDITTRFKTFKSNPTVELVYQFGYLIAVVFAILVVVLVLFGCGGGSASVSQSKPPVTAPPPTTPPPTTPPPTTPPPVTPPPVTPPPVTPPPVTPPPVTPPPTNPPPPTSVSIQDLGAGQAPITRIESNGTIDVAFDTGAGIAVRRSTNNGASFSDPVIAVPAGIVADEFQFMLDITDTLYVFAVLTPTGASASATLAIGDGKTFSTTAIPSHGFFPQLVAMPDGVIDVLWLDGITSDLHEIHSKDGAKTFSPDRILWKAGTNDAINIVATPGTDKQIYVVWGSEADTTCDLLFTVSLDEGETFILPPAQINPPDGGCHVDPTPRVNRMGDYTVSWNEGGSAVLFSESRDQGQTFSTPAFAIANAIEVNAQDFAFGPDGQIDLVYDAAAIGDNFDVFFTQSSDNGQTFSKPVKLNLPTVQNFTGGGDPAIGVDANGKITVAWDDDSNGSFSGDDDIYARTSTDGVNFSDPQNLSGTTDQQEVIPMVIETPNARYLTWFDTANSNRPSAKLDVFFDPVQ